MFVQINFIIALSIFVLYLYFFPRSQNRRRNNYPSLKKIDKILKKYYKSYFFKFSSKDDFPKLKDVYDEIRYFLSKEEISKDVLEMYTKSERLSNINLLASVCSSVLTFIGAKELAKLLNIGQQLTDFYKNISKNETINDIINHIVSFLNNTLVLIFGGVVVIIASALFLFFLRADKQKVAVKFSYNKQKRFIIKDILSSYDVTKSYENHNICHYIDFLDLGLAKSKDGYKMSIPTQFQTSSMIKNYDFSESLDELSVQLQKDDSELTCNFKKEKGCWVLVTAQNEETEVLNDNLEGLKIVFEMLFKYADLLFSQNGVVGRKLDAIIESAIKQSMLVKIFLVFPVIVIFSIICTFLIIVLIGTGLFYLFIAGYLIWLISNWLLKNYY
ncbi:hypothetical protein [Streptococcus salivarius]|uniref:hypothetical protein n=1 Tax=Streptococcus salivarius TaxID=1304 RepID=UPI00158438FF|nr:hypothetical protein [Streptococcus salivarius]